jgi:hypothetical protein
MSVFWSVIVVSLASIPKLDVYEHQWKKPNACQSDALIDVRPHNEEEWRVTTCEGLVHNYTLSDSWYPCGVFLRLETPGDMALDVTHQAYGGLTAWSATAQLRQAAIQVCLPCCPSQAQVRSAKSVQPVAKR